MAMQGPSTEQPKDWAVVVTLGCTEAISYGVLYYAFAVFLKPMQAEMGWSRSLLTGAFSLALLLSGVAGLAVGRWLDIHGPHVLMTFGSVCAAALILAWSQTHSLLTFYLTWCAIGLIMAAVLYEPAFWVVATRFERHRGRALTVLTFVAGFASVIFVPLAGALVQAQGWRGALVTLAAILAIVTIPAHGLALRAPYPARLRLLPYSMTQRKGDAKHSISRTQALHSASFWWLSLAFFLITLSSAALATHLVPLLTERGYSPLIAASIVGAFGLAALPGRLIFTPLGDRFPREYVNALLFLLHALGLIALLTMPGLAGVVLFVALFGTAFGAVTPARAGIVAAMYGSANYGQINGVIAFAMTLARAAGPFAISLLYDQSKGYRTSLVALTVTAVLAIVALFRADRLAKAEAAPIEPS
ncbi:MAG TPA: MFS transporter [Ktedonobacterales bacterium]